MILGTMRGRFFRILDWRAWRWRWRRLIGFFLRGCRGWAPHDTWGLDHYLADVIAGSLVYLAKHHRGVPNEFAERHTIHALGCLFRLRREEFCTCGAQSDLDAADREWTVWLLDKAAWFDWYAKDEDGTSDDKGWIEPGLSGEEKRRRIDAHHTKMEKFFQEVLPDFVKHWGSLWD